GRTPQPLSSVRVAAVKTNWRRFIGTQPGRSGRCYVRQTPGVDPTRIWNVARFAAGLVHQDSGRTGGGGESGAGVEAATCGLEPPLGRSCPAAWQVAAQLYLADVDSR